MSSPQAAQSSGPSQPTGSDWQAQVTQQSGPSGQPDLFQQSPQPDPIDLLAAQFSEGQSTGSFRGAPVGYGAPASGAQALGRLIHEIAPEVEKAVLERFAALKDSRPRTGGFHATNLDGIVEDYQNLTLEFLHRVSDLEKIA